MVAIKSLRKSENIDDDFQNFTRTIYDHLLENEIDEYNYFNKLVNIFIGADDFMNPFFADLKNHKNDLSSSSLFAHDFLDLYKGKYKSYLSGDELMIDAYTRRLNNLLDR